MATRTSSRARASARLEKTDLLDIYRLMLLARRIDDKEIQLKGQKYFLATARIGRLAGSQCRRVPARTFDRPR